MSFLALSLGCLAVFAILCVVQNDVTGNNNVEIVSAAVRISVNFFFMFVTSGFNIVKQM